MEEVACLLASVGGWEADGFLLGMLWAVLLAPALSTLKTGSSSKQEHSGTPVEMPRPACTGQNKWHLAILT